MNGVLNSILGEWDINGLVQVQDGQPVDVEQSTITSSTYSLIQRPNLSGSPILSSGRTVKKWFNTSVFSAFFISYGMRLASSISKIATCVESRNMG